MLRPALSSVTGLKWTALLLYVPHSFAMTPHAAKHPYYDFLTDNKSCCTMLLFLKKCALLLTFFWSEMLFFFRTLLHKNSLKQNEARGFSSLHWLNFCACCFMDSDFLDFSTKIRITQ